MVNGSVSVARALLKVVRSPIHRPPKLPIEIEHGFFSVQFVNITYNDGIFSVSGTANSVGMFGELGTERNGFFVQ